MLFLINNHYYLHLEAPCDKHTHTHRQQ